MRGQNTVLSLRATGTVVRRVMGEHLVRMTFARPYEEAPGVSGYVDFQIGDTVEVYGITYTLKQLPSPVRKHEGADKFTYTLEFQAPYYDLRDVQYFSLNTDNSLGLGVHTLTDKARGFLELLLRNLNRTQTGWSLGTIIDTDYKTLSFSGNNCLDVLSQLAAEFGTEWHVEGKVIHLYRRGTDLDAEPHMDAGVTLQYGPGKALTGIERVNQDDKLVTRLYAYGSDKNLLGGYRDFAPRLLLPVSQQKPDGLYLSRNEQEYGIREETVFFDDIYPQRIGEVTSVSTPFKFRDEGMDFNVNTQLIPGTFVKVNFLTGQLAGYDFELLGTNQSTTASDGYDNVTKEFTLLKNQDEKAIDLPNADLRPEVGDLYFLSDLIMPQEYEDEAEANLLEVATFYHDLNGKSKVSYNLSTNRNTLKDESIWLELCQSVRVVEPIFNLDKKLRIVGLERNINDPYDIKPVVSETVPLLQSLLARQRQRQLDRILRNRDKKPPVTAETSWQVQAASRRCVTDAAGKNTGDEEWAILEQVYTLTRQLTGAVKPNTFGQPDYVAPVPNQTACPIAQVVIPQPPTGNTLSLSFQTISPYAFRVTVSRNTSQGALFVNYSYEYTDAMGDFIRRTATMGLPDGRTSQEAEITVPGGFSGLSVSLMNDSATGLLMIE